MGKQIQYSKCQLSGRGGPGQVGQKPTKKIPSTPPFIETVEMESRERIIGVSRHETIGQ